MIIPSSSACWSRSRACRNSGVLDMLVGTVAWGSAHGITPNSPVIATALMKSISGSGARAMGFEVMKTTAWTRSSALVTSAGNVDTTFYIIALTRLVGYKTRYGRHLRLLADLCRHRRVIWVG